MTTKAEILKSIRANCLECSGDSSNEVQLCTVTGCALHHLRFGKDPNPARGAPKNGFLKKVPTGGDLNAGNDFGYPSTKKSSIDENAPPVRAIQGRKRISDGTPSSGTQEGGRK